MAEVFILTGAIFGLMVLMPFLYLIIHYGLEERFYIPFALAYCRKNGRDPIKWRCAPAFHNGFKTEFTIVQVLCSDDNDHKSLARLLVWVFGVKKVLDWNAPFDEDALELPYWNLKTDDK
jgi:glucose-6-phosphate-specific signal transduction histidine kinase